MVFLNALRRTVFLVGVLVLLVLITASDETRPMSVILVCGLLFGWVSWPLTVFLDIVSERIAAWLERGT